VSQSTHDPTIPGAFTPAAAVATGEISLSISVDEANLILESLGQLPFVRVYALIAKVQRQARTQLETGQTRNGAAGEA
jgi:hypothetical protein